MSGSANMEQRRARVRLETARHRVEGSLTLPRDGYRSRVSDFLNTAERGPFLSLTDATLTPLDGGAPERHPFLAVSRGQIVFVIELESEEQTSSDGAAEGGATVAEAQGAASGEPPGATPIETHGATQTEARSTEPQAV